jgi:DNA-binding NtrC family response regulator
MCHVITITAAHDAAKRASQVRAVGVVNKPFELEDLLATVARVVCGVAGGGLQTEG